jgi:REP element-mobilizing transposase RayT
MHAVAIGGIEDHAHALMNMGPNLGIAKAVQMLKANSSRWMNEHQGFGLNGKKDILRAASAGPRCRR